MVRVTSLLNSGADLETVDGGVCVIVTLYFYSVLTFTQPQGPGGDPVFVRSFSHTLCADKSAHGQAAYEGDNAYGSCNVPACTFLMP